MSENKDLNNLEDELEQAEAAEEAVEEVTDVAAEEEPAEDNIEKELEELRDVFQQELDKAVAEAGNGETAEETDEPNPEDMCLCCGEREKMEGSDYCEDCYDAMRHYPFKWAYFLVAAVFIYIAILAVGKIADINQGWVYDYEGKILADAGWYEAASEKFQMAQNYLYRAQVEPKMIYIHSLETSYESGGFNVINSFPTSVATLFEEWELNLPYMKTLKQYYLRSQEIAATIQQVNDRVFSEYSETAVEDLPYDKIINKISEFEALGLHIGLDDDGNEIADETVKDGNGQMSSSNAVYFKRTTKYDKAMLQYFKYYFASTCKRPYEERVGYLEAVKANAPDLVWLYAGELGTEYAQNGEKEKALEMADLIYEKSETNPVSYYIRTMVAKLIDKDYDKAIEWCEKGNGYTDNDELYRQMALCYLMKGEYKKAQENAQSAYDINMSTSTVNTLALCAAASGDKDKFEEMQGVYDEYNTEVEDEKNSLSLPKAILEVKNGKKTAEQVLEQGGYDING